MSYFGINDGSAKFDAKNTITLNDINIQGKMTNKTIIKECRH